MNLFGKATFKTIHCFILVFTLFALSCTPEGQRSDLEVINAFIEARINQQKSDIRIYQPPPPPELQDSLGVDGRTKPGSIINKLPPLTIYINPVIEYNKEPIAITDNSLGDLSFIGDVRPTVRRLNSIHFSQKKGVSLQLIDSGDFFASYKKLRQKSGYGGYYSFQNLYYSKNLQKAYFKISHYKGKLGGSTYAVLCTKNMDGTWTFKMQLLSIS
ncbi:hypothetical protein [Flagellimonas okinawensis]|uniref:Lipoprotein n=1 Tax=Flagellimonas okinawensis TaxID=3031324 RepID=A0ABT5XLK6_9FLAO|nr:hypothetical protein [[Muricauda] okinawensis]MDF0706707.1 hypothetical protein [[Muricauda] okinawensis]